MKVKSVLLSAGLLLLAIVLSGLAGTAHAESCDGCTVKIKNIVEYNVYITLDYSPSGSETKGPLGQYQTVTFSVPAGKCPLRLRGWVDVSGTRYNIAGRCLGCANQGENEINPDCSQPLCDSAAYCVSGSKRTGFRFSGYF